jgi:plastocyanin
MKPIFLISLGVLTAHADSVIEGHIKLPESKKAAPVMVKRYKIVTKGGVLSTEPPVAVVYLEGGFAKQDKLPVRQIIQKDFIFNPSLLPVRTGTTVEFPNKDDAYHNVFSFSPAKRFDLGRHRPEDRPVPSQTFDKPGMVTLRCDIHEHMRAIVLVLDTPHFVISDANGNFKLRGLPAGTYKLKAWINSRSTLEKAVTLDGRGTVKLDFP